jgi:hypothetical protein
MPKKSRTEITEKLNALKPGEPTRTRGKAVRKPAKLKIQVKEGLPPHDPQPALEPQRDIPTPGIAIHGVPTENAEVYSAIYEGWFQIVRNCSGMVADCNRMFLSSISHFMDSGRWRRS